MPQVLLPAAPARAISKAATARRFDWPDSQKRSFVEECRSGTNPRVHKAVRGTKRPQEHSMYSQAGSVAHPCARWYLDLAFPSTDSCIRRETPTCTPSRFNRGQPELVMLVDHQVLRRVLIGGKTVRIRHPSVKVCLATRVQAGLCPGLARGLAVVKVGKARSGSTLIQPSSQTSSKS